MILPDFIEAKIQAFLQREGEHYLDMYSEAEVKRLLEPQECFLRMCVENMVEDGLDWEEIARRIT